MILPADIRELAAFKVGHATDEQAGTGCTAIIAPEGAVGAVDVRGGAPATRETDLLLPENAVEQVHAVVLSGGSLFGLEASCGVVRALSERGIGMNAWNQFVPIVVGASIFDLPVGRPGFPDVEMGRQAVADAFARNLWDDFPHGNVGAGTGASVGKYLGFEGATKTGLGYACVRRGEVLVGAIVSLNAAGSIIDEQARTVAGCVSAHGSVINPIEAAECYYAAGDGFDAPTGSNNTTIGCIITNAALTKAQLKKICVTAHDAYARRIVPVHTQDDGDAVFALASGEVPSPMGIVSLMGTQAMASAILDAVHSAKAAYGLPAACDLRLR